MTQRMRREPEVRWRDAQPYVGIRRAVTMTTIDQLADRIPEIVGWLAARGTDVAAPPS
ncbi:hypothetical protein [Cellulomonas sp. NS3]|uniref:hypothetical protein n=1 Tax=Cellulomonas sp. NS3 TaxID=2973977 RepID=UPI002162D767|nr:hypothetical protein [Cellulomonas sp. NS3]